MNEWVKRGKDDNPVSTVNRIKTILENNGINHWSKIISEQFDSCFFSQVEVDGLIANGKGFSKDLCEASGYAELMERLQNKRITTLLPCYDSYFQEETEKYSKDMSALSLSKHYLQLISKLKENAIELGETPENSQKIIDNLINEHSTNGKHIFGSFVSLKTKKVELLPINVVQIFTGTNGMAAGNTVEEAIVQGACEILERYSAINIFKNKLTPPEIPRPVIFKYPNLKKIIRKIEEDTRYTVTIYDASLGTGIPCVMCIIKNNLTQTIGIKFGAYTELEIAIERCLSEAFQGQNLEQFSKSCTVSFAEHTRASWLNILNILKVSHGEYPASLFYGEPSWELKQWDSLSAINNRERLKILELIFETLGSELLVYNASILGFPSVYLYVPNISEIAPVDVLWLQEQKLSREVEPLFLKLGTLSHEEINKIKTLALLKRKSYLENTINHLARLNFKMLKRDVKDELGYLAAICSFAMGNTEECIAILRGIPHTPYTRIAYLYLKAKESLKSTINAKNVIRNIASKDIFEQVIDDFSDANKILLKTLKTCSYKCDICKEKCMQNKIRNLGIKVLNAEKIAGPLTAQVLDALK